LLLTKEDLFYVEDDPAKVHKFIKGAVEDIKKVEENVKGAVEDIKKVEENVTALKIKSGSPVNAKAATGTFTLTGAVTDGETVSIGITTYEFDTDSNVTEGNILVDVSGGATAPDAVTALVAAITANTESIVSAEDGVNDTVVLTSKIKGVASNNLITTATTAMGSFAKGTLEGGVDGTVGNKNECYIDDSYLYYAIADNTISEANWRRISLGNVY